MSFCANGLKGEHLLQLGAPLSAPLFNGLNAGGQREEQRLKAGTPAANRVFRFDRPVDRFCFLLKRRLRAWS